ncbi:MAG TPA: hydroxymethylbilane synthase [Phycisphaerae bacterium]|nr:hydroxymethylbilane synthase [Phycisphaerae bacterium]
MPDGGSNTLVVGTRGSLLAVTQTNWVVERIRRHNPGLEVRVERISTRGDQQPDVPLPQVGQKGIFTRELEEALCDGRIDLAVHSAKDLPQDEDGPSGLAILCVPPREDPRDALISREGRKLADLPTGATIGTSSLRRQAQLRLVRSDLKFCVLRGNVDTRIKKVHRGDCDATLLALAGLRRVGLTEHVTEALDVDRMVPAPAQGILAVQGRAGDERVRGLLRPIHDDDASLSLTHERMLVDRLGGGCATPIGALLTLDGRNVTLTAVVASPSGDRGARASHTVGRADAADAVQHVLDELLAGGADEIIESCREE